MSLNGKGNGLVESVVEPYLFTDLELVEIKAVHAAAASQCEQSTSIPPQPVPQTSGDWWCSCGIRVIMPTEMESCCPPFGKKKKIYII